MTRISARLTLTEAWTHLLRRKCCIFIHRVRSVIVLLLFLFLFLLKAASSSRSVPYRRRAGVAVLRGWTRRTDGSAGE